MTSSLSCKLWLITTGKISTIKLKKQDYNSTSSRKWLKRWWIRFKYKINHQKIWINQRTRILPLWYQLKIRLQHFKVEILQNIVECGLSKMRPAHQNSMNFSSRNNSKETLIFTSKTSTTPSIYVSMWWLVQSIKRHSDFEEYFVPDHYQHYYSWNSQAYTSI